MNETLLDHLGVLKSLIKLQMKMMKKTPKEIDVTKYVNEHKKEYHLSEEDSNILIKALEDFFGGGDEPIVISTHKPGWVKKAILEKKYDPNFWARYSSYLLSSDENFPVPSLDISTSKILDYLHDPMSPGKWSRKGMVVGHVQSGKTSNYIGLINKAVGHGYKLIIVLTGMFDDLRIQTQERIDYGVIGKLSASTSEMPKGKKIGVGKHKELLPKTEVMSLTSINPSTNGGDFNSSSAPNVSLSKGNRATYIISIKKNKAPLGEVINWLTSLVDEFDKDPFVKNLPTLIIDDEADSASVDTSKKEEDPKTINRYIRVILNLLEKVTYLGYTATPYANIFIEPSDNEKTVLYKNRNYDVTKDLFPSDFIINLQPPINYFGPHKVFSNTYSSHLVKTLEDFKDNYRSVFPASIKTETKMPTELVPSLVDAINHYIITTIIREKRDGKRSHNSMLVHVSLRILWIDRVASLIHNYLIDLRKKVISDNEEVYELFKQIFERIESSSTVLSNVFNLDSKQFSFDEIWKKLVDSLTLIEVVAVHGGNSQYHLDHEITNFEYGKNPRYYICVGGNRLSRGITLQGLTTSYFIRVSKMYDSLMQMGRWFGYRKNYADLCRLYTSKELASWYEFITEATEELRDEFNYLNHKITPSTYALKVKKSPDMLKITSLGKMRYTRTIATSFDGRSPTLTEFGVDPFVHERNLNKTFNSLSKLGNLFPNKQTKSFLWTKQNTDQIITILRDFEVHSNHISRHELLIQFIEENKNLYSNNWNVLLFSNSNKNMCKGVLNINGKKEDIYSVRRSNGGGDDESFKLIKDSLTGGYDKVLDYRILLNLKKEDLSLKQGYELRAKENTPLLLLYLIDGYNSIGHGRTLYDGEESSLAKSKIAENGVLIPSYFIVFPGDIKDKVKKVDYVCNLIDNNDYQQSDDEE